MFSFPETRLPTLGPYKSWFGWFLETAENFECSAERLFENKDHDQYHDYYHYYYHRHDLDHDLDHVLDHLTMIKTMLIALTMTKKRVKDCDVSAVCSIFVQFLRCSLQQIGQICAAAVILLRNQPSLSSYLFVLFLAFLWSFNHICCYFFWLFYIF